MLMSFCRNNWTTKLETEEKLINHYYYYCYPFINDTDYIILASQKPITVQPKRELNDTYLNPVKIVHYLC